MQTVKVYFLFINLLVGAVGARAQGMASDKPTIVFVHGVWADGSCWTDAITALQADGYAVGPFKIR